LTNLAHALYGLGNIDVSIISYRLDLIDGEHVNFAETIDIAEYIESSEQIDGFETLDITEQINGFETLDITEQIEDFKNIGNFENPNIAAKIDVTFSQFAELCPPAPKTSLDIQHILMYKVHATCASTVVMLTTIPIMLSA